VGLNSDQVALGSMNCDDSRSN